MEKYQVMKVMTNNVKILQISDLEYSILETSVDIEDWLKKTEFKYSTDHSSGIFETIIFEDASGAVEFKLRFVDVE